MGASTPGIPIAPGSVLPSRAIGRTLGGVIHAWRRGSDHPGLVVCPESVRVLSVRANRAIVETGNVWRSLSRRVTETPAERRSSWYLTADMSLEQEREVRDRRTEELRRTMSADDERRLRRRLGDPRRPVPLIARLRCSNERHDATPTLTSRPRTTTRSRSSRRRAPPGRPPRLPDAPLVRRRVGAA